MQLGSLPSVCRIKSLFLHDMESIPLRSFNSSLCAIKPIGITIDSDIHLTPLLSFFPLKIVAASSNGTAKLLFLAGFRIENLDLMDNRQG